LISVHCEPIFSYGKTSKNNKRIKKLQTFIWQGKLPFDVNRTDFGPARPSADDWWKK
jgi:hypothetical protein